MVFLKMLSSTSELEDMEVFIFVEELEVLIFLILIFEGTQTCRMTPGG